MYCNSQIYDTSKRMTLTRFKIGETPPIAEKNPKSTVIYKLYICMILGEMFTQRTETCISFEGCHLFGPRW